jgi:2-polyprenyl-3-methyl-5-hydroxy-6-metoxy-1,4-benzoquinol methylase
MAVEPEKCPARRIAISTATSKEQIDMMSRVDGSSIRNPACPCCGGSSPLPWMKVEGQSQYGPTSYDLLRCASCQHTWLDNRPTVEEMTYYYSPSYHRVVGHAGETSPKRWERQCRVILKYKSGGNILDIGCSSGGFLASLRKGPWKLYGIELSAPTAERARAITGGDIFAGDVVDATFPHESFDVITCSDVMEHFYDPQEVFRRIYSWLKPGGIVYIFVPNIMSWEARIFRSHWFGLDLPRHLHHYSANSLSRFADTTGLRKVRMVTPPGCYLEESTFILLDALARRSGFRQTAMDVTAEAGIIRKVLRKGLRLSLEALYSKVASYCGAAPSLQAVFQKASSPEPAAGTSVSRWLVVEKSSSSSRQMSTTPFEPAAVPSEAAGAVTPLVK